MIYNIEKGTVCLSVTELCQRATLCGDLDLRPGKRRHFSPARAAIGAEAHRLLQSEAGEGYEAEVPLSDEIRFRDLVFAVSGRADGVINGDPVTVEEIKSVVGKHFPSLVPLVYDAQLKCYAYLLCRKRGLGRICTRLTYYRPEDGELRHHTSEYTREELERFFLELLRRVEFSARFHRERMSERLPSARDGRFPYPEVREGQEELLKECYRDIRAGKRLFAQAPTGIGKTMSTLYPAVRALGEGYCDKIFYLTAKASTGREAYRAASQIFKSGSLLRAIVLTAREQICRNEEACRDEGGISSHCNPVNCPYARGFFDRCDTAICDALSKHNGFGRDLILSIAETHKICPYEFQLALSEYCDTVICDYNYAFDPQVYLRRYFGEDATDNGRYVFLVDEAHNLLDRARGMYSAELSNTALSRVFFELTEAEAELKKPLEALAVAMRDLRRLCKDNLYKDESGRERGYYVSRQPLLAFGSLVSETHKRLETWLRSNAGSEREVLVLSLSATLKRFDLILEYYDECFLTFVEVDGDCVTVKLICLDPSRVLDACLSRSSAAVLFSATLTPTDYFADVLGGGKGAIRISLPSPFEESNLCPVAVTGVNTRFEERDKSYRRIASLIAACASAKFGNYIAYFPSYEYMEAVHKAFCERYPQITTILQTKGMRQSEREQFLASFSDDEKLRIGFCVLGGSFSEGVDLPGRRLIGTLIVGIGLPGLSNERNILKEYYDVTRERGYDYAYLYPGINRVLQAAGRVIRCEEDRGVVVLIDDRYESEQMRSLLPQHWSHLQYARNAKELAEIAAEFWNKFENN